MSTRLVLTTFALAAGSLLAQEPTTGRAQLPRLSARTWSEATSRDLFAGCDADADDRLDIFEASEALDALDDPKNSESFARLDTNRDGFLSWPEFDQHFWNVVQAGNTFHVRPCRQGVEQAPEQREARPDTGLQKFLSLHDQNGDGALDPTELERMVLRTNLPPAIASQLRTLDADQSGKVDAAELAPIFELLRGRVPEATTTAPKTGGALLSPWHDNDADRNGRIDAAELAATLRRIDPSLARWADALMKLLDRDKDGSLSGDELPVVRRPQRTPPSTAKADTADQRSNPVAGTRATH
ncbi:MAG: hypothetical protein JNK78_18170 [Planctomycetes bacterium]|nr:hypothetical protein [Planctomycetota bacterium]